DLLVKNISESDLGLYYCAHWERKPAKNGTGGQSNVYHYGTRTTRLSLFGVLFSRISGAEVEMRVRPGDDVVLYCDCVWETWPPVWFKKSLNEGQPPLIISGETLIHAAFSRYSLMWNKVNQTNDLLVTNFSESDLGLYYCALRERKPVKDGTGAEVLRDVYHNGTRTTRLSLLGK
ncbi:hypothetical protein NFI96_031958, partial [Prochilodus magdalenae]